ncbi:MAG: hypothetical protein R3E68_07895 [Burkholderiaceae bacterium]
MDWSLVIIQLLNGLQLGVLLFLLSAGLTLTFGIMDFINLAHGSFYMVGAFACAVLTQWTDSFVLGVLLAIPVTALIGGILEVAVIRPPVCPRPPGPRAGHVRPDPGHGHAGAPVSAPRAWRFHCPTGSMARSRSPRASCFRRTGC